MKRTSWLASTALSVLALTACSQAPAPPPAQASAPAEAGTPGGQVDSQAASNGLTGVYYDNIDFTGPSKTQVDATINKNFGTAAPVAGIAPNTYSVRWTGQVQPKYSETYTFYTKADDGVRLMVNGQVLVNNWADQGATTKSGTVTLQAGVKYDLRLEYYQNTGGAQVKLEWQSPSQARQVVPQASLWATGSNLLTAISALKSQAQIELLPERSSAAYANEKFVFYGRGANLKVTYLILSEVNRAYQIYKLDASNPASVTISDVITGNSINLGAAEAILDSQGGLRTDKIQFLAARIADLIDISFKFNWATGTNLKAQSAPEPISGINFSLNSVCPAATSECRNNHYNYTIDRNTFSLTLASLFGVALTPCVTGPQLVVCLGSAAASIGIGAIATPPQYVKLTESEAAVIGCYLGYSFVGGEYVKQNGLGNPPGFSLTKEGVYPDYIRTYINPQYITMYAIKNSSTAGRSACFSTYVRIMVKNLETGILTSQTGQNIVFASPDQQTEFSMLALCHAKTHEGIDAQLFLDAYTDLRMSIDPDGRRRLTALPIRVYERNVKIHCLSGPKISPITQQPIPIEMLVGETKSATSSFSNLGDEDLKYRVAPLGYVDDAIDVRITKPVSVDQETAVKPQAPDTIDFTATCKKPGLYTPIVDLSSNDPDKPVVKLSLVVDCKAPDFTLSTPAPMSTYVNSTTTSSFTITNLNQSGPLNYTVSAPTKPWLQRSSASGTVAAGGQAKVDLTGTCPANPMTDSDTLTVADTATGKSKPVTVTLECIKPPGLNYSTQVDAAFWTWGSYEWCNGAPRCIGWQVVAWPFPGRPVLAKGTYFTDSPTIPQRESGEATFPDVVKIYYDNLSSQELSTNRVRSVHWQDSPYFGHIYLEVDVFNNNQAPPLCAAPYNINGTPC